jgi:ATP-dependent protease ClpP protease subunit
MNKHATPIRSSANPPSELARPQIRLDGPVNDEMLRAFRDFLDTAEAGEGPVVVELSTTGGDADVGRRIATDIRLFGERTGRSLRFFGKAVVYSAGVTIMAAVPREGRWLSRGTSLLIHCRSLNKTLQLDGALSVERVRLEAVLAEIDVGMKLEEEGFKELIAGSDVPMGELLERARSNWYLDADEALERGLIGGVV